MSAATTTFAQSKLPFLDMAASQQLLSEALKRTLEPAFARLGLALDSFVVEAVSLPDALNQSAQARQSLAIVGNVQQYALLQAARSLPDAARHPAGLAGIGVGVATGAGLGQLMGRALGASPELSPSSPPSSPGPAPEAALVPCSACSKGLEPGSAFCRFCGQAQARGCPSCHADVAPGSAVCRSCGYKLGA